MAELKLYDAGEDLYEVLPRQSRAGTPAGRGRTYLANILPNLVKEQEKGDEGGFVVEEVWEKCIRSGVAGMWDLPLGWDETTSQDGVGGVTAAIQGEVAMKVE